MIISIIIIISVIIMLIIMIIMIIIIIIIIFIISRAERVAATLRSGDLHPKRAPWSPPFKSKRHEQ